ncbi:hypothetical protein LDENG_00061810 [Lucifuga dentata]|nr:hypothetical protein LDENG_00061810 [Lucifuga dentata]
MKEVDSHPTLSQQRTERCGDNRTQRRRRLQDARQHIQRHTAARWLLRGDTPAFLPAHLALVCAHISRCVHQLPGQTGRNPEPSYGNHLNVTPAFSCCSRPS